MPSLRSTAWGEALAGSHASAPGRSSTPCPTSAAARSASSAMTLGKAFSHASRGRAPRWAPLAQRRSLRPGMRSRVSARRSSGPRAPCGLAGVRRSRTRWPGRRRARPPARGAAAGTAPRRAVAVPGGGPGTATRPAVSGSARARRQPGPGSSSGRTSGRGRTCAARKSPARSRSTSAAARSARRAGRSSRTAPGNRVAAALGSGTAMSAAPKRSVGGPTGSTGLPSTLRRSTTDVAHSTPGGRRVIIRTTHQLMPCLLRNPMMPNTMRTSTRRRCMGLGASPDTPLRCQRQHRQTQRCLTRLVQIGFRDQWTSPLEAAGLRVPSSWAELAWPSSHKDVLRDTAIRRSCEVGG